MNKRERHWFFQFNYWVIIIFVLIRPFLIGAGKIRILGALLVCVALMFQLNRGSSFIGKKTPLELKSYTLWGVWAIASGLLVAKYPEIVWWNAKVLLQMIVLLWSCYAVFSAQKEKNYFYYSVLGLSLLQVGASYMGFHLDSDVSGGIARDVMDEGVRTEGLTGNANSMGFQMLAGIWACLLLWPSKRNFLKFLKWACLGCAIVVFGYYTIQTASRKSLLVLVLLIGGWGVWALPGKLSIKTFLISIGISVLLVIIGASVIGYVMNDTLAGARFMQWFDAGGGSAVEGFQENIRYSMYVDGLKFWISHPIAGIGFGHFAVWHWSGLYSHSDYIEPLACTGLVGFILYHGFATVVLIRLIKLLCRKSLPEEISYQVKCMLLFMICNHFLIGLGCPHWQGILHEIIVVFIGTHSWRMERHIRHMIPVNGKVLI